MQGQLCCTRVETRPRRGSERTCSDTKHVSLHSTTVLGRFDEMYNLWLLGSKVPLAVLLLLHGKLRGVQFLAAYSYKAIPCLYKEPYPHTPKQEAEQSNPRTQPGPGPLHIRLTHRILTLKQRSSSAWLLTVTLKWQDVLNNKSLPLKTYRHQILYPFLQPPLAFQWKLCSRVISKTTVTVQTEQQGTTVVTALVSSSFQV